MKRQVKQEREIRMIYFNCDYNEGAHPRILERLVETNMEQLPGYSEDHYCEEARKVIRKVCSSPEAEVHFLVGGTQANLTVISSILRPHQAALCVESGHINVHETGAIEACGHKVMTVPGRDGKLFAEDVRRVHEAHWKDESFEHITQPKLVYISHPTEYGTLYTKQELEELKQACEECGMYLFLDGARMGYGLCAEGTDVTLPVIAKCTDVFYIGGTKVGALFGEAVVFPNRVLSEEFRYIIKQKGGMLAKGRFLGIQFLELFRDGLYFDISRHAIEMAMMLKQGAKELGIPFFMESSTNQQFLILPEEKIAKLRENYGFAYIQPYDEKSGVIRLCTSWATKEADVRKLLDDLKQIMEEER